MGRRSLMARESIEYKSMNMTTVVISANTISGEQKALTQLVPLNRVPSSLFGEWKPHRFSKEDGDGSRGCKKLTGVLWRCGLVNMSPSSSVFVLSVAAAGPREPSLGRLKFK